MSAERTAKCHERRSRARGYTMIELLIVVGLIGVIGAIAVPNAVRMLEKGPMRQALSDIGDGCAQARARAILGGRPMSLILRAGDNTYSLSVGPAGGANATGGAFAGAYTTSGGSGKKSRLKPFRATFHEDIAIEQLMVNLQNAMESEEVRVTFYPNGVSDELIMTIGLMFQDRHEVKIDPITGIPEIEKLK